MIEPFRYIYDDPGKSGNARLAVRMCDAAMAKRNARLFRLWKQKEERANTAKAEKAAAAEGKGGDGDGAAAVAFADTAGGAGGAGGEGGEGGEGGDGGTSASVELIAGDFGIGLKLGESQEKKDALDRELERLIGMDEAKELFASYKDIVSAVESGLQSRSALKVCLNLVITGNPGTGKTSFSRLLHKFLYTYGVLRKDNFVERNGLDLKGQFVGQTGPAVKECFKQAMGGTLFLDEAYNLAGQDGVEGGSDPYARDAVGTLLTEVENNRTGLMVVMGGYKLKMNKLLRFDPGLARRFPKRLDLKVRDG